MGFANNSAHALQSQTAYMKCSSQAQRTLELLTPTLLISIRMTLQRKQLPSPTPGQRLNGETTVQHSRSQVSRTRRAIFVSTFAKETRPMFGSRHLPWCASYERSSMDYERAVVPPQHISEYCLQGFVEQDQCRRLGFSIRRIRRTAIPWQRLSDNMNHRTLPNTPRR